MSTLIFITSSVSSSLNTINKISSNFEETSINESISGYTDEDNLNQRKTAIDQANWYVRFNSQFVLYLFLIIGFFDVLGLFRFKENTFLENTYPLMVIFLALTLLTIDLGSIARFRYVFYLIILSRYTILAGLQPFDIKLKFVSLTFLPILSLYAIVSMRSGFYTVDPLLLINNAFTTFLIHSDISLSELLIGH